MLQVHPTPPKKKRKAVFNALGSAGGGEVGVSAHGGLFFLLHSHAPASLCPSVVGVLAFGGNEEGFFTQLMGSLTPDLEIILRTQTSATTGMPGQGPVRNHLGVQNQGSMSTYH